jgi:hypothetical protein
MIGTIEKLSALLLEQHQVMQNSLQPINRRAEARRGIGKFISLISKSLIHSALCCARHGNFQ